MGLFVYFAVPLICTLLFRHFIRQPTGALFLEGLHTFLPQSSAIPNPPPGPKVSKRDRKLLHKRQVQLQGAQSTVVIQQLSPSALAHLNSEPTTFGSNFETLGILLLVLFVGLVVHFTLGPLFGLWQEILLYTLGPLVVLWAASQLVLLECNGSLARLLPWGDRFRVVVLAAVAGTGAFVLLQAAPPGWVRWDVGAAAGDLDKLVNGGMARLVAARMRHYVPPPPVRSDPTHISFGLAAVAGVIAAALLGPCARVAKLYFYSSPVPVWAARYLTPHPLASTVVKISLVMPLLVVLYGIVPMSDWWPALPGGASAAAALGPALVAATALLTLLAVRPLAAAHLQGGLLEWHLLRHEVPATGAAAGAAVQTAKDTLLRKRLTLVYATICQVGLQLLAPAAILVCLALVYGAASGVMDPFRPPKPLLVDLGGSNRTARVMAPVQRLAEAMAPPPPPSPPPQAAAAAAAAASGLLEGLDEVVVAPEPAAAAGAAAGGTSGGGLPPMPPLDFVVFASSFLAWWTCAVMCLFTYPLMFVYRTGLHIG